MKPRPAPSTTTVAEKSVETWEPVVVPKRSPLSIILSRDFSTMLTFAGVVALLFAGFMVRTQGNDFGLPYLFHPDELPIVERAISIIRTGDFNPRWFHYPSLYMYVQALSDILVYLSTASGEHGAFSFPLPAEATTEYVRFGRTTTAIMGTLTILLVFYAGRAISSTRLGLIASSFLAFSLLHSIHSHYVTTDVPMAFFTTLAFLMSLLVLSTGDSRYYLVAGLAAGLAASTKYNGAIAIVSLAAAHLFVALRSRSLKVFSLTFTFAGFAAGFIMATPYALLELPTFLKDFAFEIAHYRSSQPGFEGDSNWLWYMETVLGSWDSVTLILAAAGAAVCLLKRRPAYLLLLAFPLLYFWWFSNFVVRFERNLVPLMPSVALLAAVFIDWLAGKLASLSPRPRVLAPLFVVVFLLPALAPSTIGILEFNNLLSGDHPKAVAAKWANFHLPSGSRIAVEQYGIPLDRKSFEIANVLFVGDHSAGWFEEQSFDYVIVSDGIWQRLYMEPNKYQDKVAAYDAVFGKFKLVKAVEMTPPSQRLVAYPTVDVYHLPKVRILQISEVEK